MANGWRRSVPRNQNMFEFKILVPDRRCVRSVSPRVAHFTRQRSVPRGYSYISTKAEINETKQHRLGNVVQL